MKKGRAGTMTHDDQRHGTTTLFAAMLGARLSVTPVPHCPAGAPAEIHY